jgi:hypothetical protein
LHPTSDIPTVHPLIAAFAVLLLSKASALIVLVGV